MTVPALLRLYPRILNLLSPRLQLFFHKAIELSR